MEIVAASLEEYERQPWEFDGFIPDVVAYDLQRQLIVLGSASLCDMQNDTSSSDKLKVLSSHAMDEGFSKGEAVPFHLIVPVDCAEKVRKYLEELGLNYNVHLWTA